MDLAVLEIFRAVAEAQSVTRAAAALNRVQSNVTTRIRQLEDELGVELFLRDGKRMKLSERGQEFLVYAQQILALTEQAKQSMHPDRPAGLLRLGTMESTAASRLPQKLARFHREHPEVELTVTTGPTGRMLDAVLERRVDCALVAQPSSLKDGRWEAEPFPPEIESLPVFTEELVLVLPEGHPVVNGPDDVSLTTLGGFASSCSYRQIAEQWFNSGNGRPFRTLKVQELGSYHGILACVTAGSCFGIVPRSVLELIGGTTNLTLHPIMQIDTQLVCRAGYNTPAFKSLRDLLLS